MLQHRNNEEIENCCQKNAMPDVKLLYRVAEKSDNPV